MMLSNQLFVSGNVNCGGCGLGTCLRMFLEVLAPDVILSIPACCAAVAVGPTPLSAFSVPVLNTAFEVTGASLSGIRAALDIKGDTKTTVVGWAGDGGTYDIGLQALSGAAERETDCIYVCYDNEAYMNTGVQRSSSTPLGGWTSNTLTKTPESHSKKDIAQIMAAHRISYIATLSPAYPNDFLEKVKKAKEIKGTRFLLMYSPCPTGWKMESKHAVSSARLAVETFIFPLYEIYGGKKYTITYQPKSPKSIEEYFGIQGRFSHLLLPENKDLLNRIKKETEEKWNYLLQMEKYFSER